MRDEQIATLAIACILGTGVLVSYVPVVKDQLGKTYDHWLQIPNDTRYMFYALQILAAVGIFTWVIHYCTRSEPYKFGLFSYSKAVVPILITIFLLSAIGWSIGTTLHVRKPSMTSAALTSGSLIVGAVCSLLLLAGQMESENPVWYATLGLLLFCLVTVLADGVGWNARFLLSLRKK